MTPTEWVQLNLHFAEPLNAEQIVVAELAPTLTEVDTSHLITAWFFLRKTPHWRLRYLPTNPAHAEERLHTRLAALQREGQLVEVTHSVYEPETRAFGGAQAMTVAHRLWHLDSQQLLAHLAATRRNPSRSQRRERAILLLSALLRGAGLDWYEQGDVWARVAAHRRPPEGLAQHANALTPQIQRLMSVDTTNLTGPAGPLSSSASWLAAYAAAGRDLRHLNAAGLLNRGLREVCAHHVIFSWNRLGLAEPVQSVLASTAATAVFGPDPRAAHRDQPELGAARSGEPVGVRP